MSAVVLTRQYWFTCQEHTYHRQAH